MKHSDLEPANVDWKTVAVGNCGSGKNQSSKRYQHFNDGYLGLKSMYSFLPTLIIVKCLETQLADNQLLQIEESWVVGNHGRESGSAGQTLVVEYLS